MILIDANWQTIANQGNYCSLDLILSSSANQIHSELTSLPSLQLPDTGNNSVPNVIINNKISSFFRTAVSILVISNHNCFPSAV